MIRPFPSNNDRASWANTALSAFVNQCGSSEVDQTDIMDLFTDLFHLCDALGVDFQDTAALAYHHYLVDIGDGGIKDVGTDPHGKADSTALDGSYGYDR